MKEFLIIQTAFIGDVVLMLPLAQQLRKLHPDAVIHILVRKGNESLLQNHPAADHVYVWDKQDGKYKSLFTLMRMLRKRNFDAVYNLQRFGATGLLTALLKSKAKIGFDKNPFSRFYTRKFPHQIPWMADGHIMHEVQRNLSLLGEERPDIIRPELYPPEAAFEKAAKIAAGRKYIVMAPASVWYTKQWHPDKWKELLKAIPEEFAVFLTGARGDRDFCEAIRSARPSADNLCGELNMLESAALMRDAHRVIVNDSAPMHFASAVNARTTAVFCSTVPAFGFFPLADDSTVVEVSKALSCRPCGLHGYKKCPEGHFKCAMDIDVAQVLQSLHA